MGYDHNRTPLATVSVPATIANLGSGFDCVGLAVDLRNSVTVRRGDFKIEADGVNADLVPRDAGNLVVKGVELVFKELGREMPELEYRMHQEIPVSRGLGSSAAAIVAGIQIGAVVAEVDMSHREMIDLAAKLEGHIDNVAPAVLGGCVIGVPTKDGWVTDSVRLGAELYCVVYVPTTEFETEQSRGALPRELPFGSAVHNVGRAMLLVNALSSGDLTYLRYAVEDKLHQPYRAPLLRGVNGIIRAAYIGGADGAFLSGSGPSVAALATTRQMTIGYEMAEAARLAGLKGMAQVFAVSSAGVEVTRGDG